MDRFQFNQEVIQMFRLISVAGGCVLLAQALAASTVYQQTPLWTGPGTNIGNTFTAQLDSNNSGWRPFDDFTLASAATINQATWYGVYMTNNGGFADGTPNTSTWDITFYADAGGAPGSTLANTVLSSAQVTTANAGSGMFGALPVTVYQFTANLPNFNAAASTRYWFSAVSQASNFSPFFAWIAGSGGDNTTYQLRYNSGSIIATFPSQGQDRALTLSSVPEPSTWMLGAGGLLAVILIRRRTVTSPSL